MNLSKFRQELAHPRTSYQLCLLGIVGGFSAALLIILFRLCVEWLQLMFLDELGQFNTLDPLIRFLLPVGAAVLIIGFAFLTGFKHYRMGIPFVIYRLKQRYGHIPFRTTINQFFGGMFALAGGFVVGREGAVCAPRRCRKRLPGSMVKTARITVSVFLLAVVSQRVSQRHLTRLLPQLFS